MLVAGRLPVRRQVLLVLVALLGLLASGGGSGASALPTGFQETTVFSGLTAPAAIEFASDGRIHKDSDRGLQQPRRRTKSANARRHLLWVGLAVGRRSAEP
jgi:hypothetical protein